MGYENGVTTTLYGQCWAEFWLQYYSYHGVLTPGVMLGPTFRPRFVMYKL